MTIRDFQNPVELEFALSEIAKNNSYLFIWFTVINKIGTRFEVGGTDKEMRAFFPKMNNNIPIENTRYDVVNKKYVSDGTIEIDFEVGWNVNIDPNVGFLFKSKSAIYSYLKNAINPEPVTNANNNQIADYKQNTDFFEAIRYEIGMLSVDYNNNPEFKSTDLSKYTTKINQLLNNLEIFINKK